MKTKFLFLTFFLCLISAFAQSNLNNYKYIVVPNKFEFQKEAHAFKLNRLSQFLFNKYGFTALMEDDDYPSDLAANGCLALQSSVVKEPGIFNTKLKVVLKDCSGKIVYTSKLGESREKEYYVAYNKAIRDAFTSFENLNYSYTASNLENVIVKNETQTNITQKVDQLKEIRKRPSIDNHSKQIEAASKLTQHNESIKMELPKSETAGATKKVDHKPNTILYAQSIKDGYQIVDSTPKIVMILLVSPVENVFIVKDKNALVYSQDGMWFYADSSKSPKKLNLKF